MNISDKVQKRLIIGVASIVFLSINIVGVFKPQLDTINEKTTQIKQNEDKIKQLNDIEGQREELEKKDKFFKNQFLGFAQKLPNYLTPEQYVTTLQNMINDNGIEASDIAFTKPELYAAATKPDYPLGGQVVTKANDIITKLYENDDEGVRATKSEIQLDEIADENLVKVDLDFSFKGPYYNVKTFIKSVENYFTNAVINTIDIKPEKDNNIISGKMQISLYAFKDSKIPVYDLWIKELQKGKNDLFGTNGSYRYDIEDTNVSDFDISLNPYTSDNTTVIMKKHGAFATGAYGDSKGNEKVELEIVKSGQAFKYRYKTTSASYPQNYTFTEFKPVNAKDIIVKVYSKPRVGEADNAGMYLTIKKPDDVNVRVMVYNDDEVRPRADGNYK